MSELSHNRIKTVISIGIIVFIVTLLGCLSGCASSLTVSSSKAVDKGEPSAIEYADEVFHDIAFRIPKDLSSESGIDENTALYTLNESSKDPYALTIWLSYDPSSDATATSWYEAFADFGECDLVASNGIEICLQQDSDTQYGYESRELHFAYNSAFYSIMIEYKISSNLGYEHYVDDFYKYVVGIGSSSSNGQMQDIDIAKSSSTLPNGAIEWSKAYQYVGKTATFYGKVVDADYASGSNGKPTFLDIGKAYPSPDRLSIVIWGEDRVNFSPSPEAMYSGKTIAVTGEVYLYNGVCNIEVSSPNQIDVLQ